jgi:hypothetical protein
MAGLAAKGGEGREQADAPSGVQQSDRAGADSVIPASIEDRREVCFGPPADAQTRLATIASAHLGTQRSIQPWAPANGGMTLDLGRAS